MFIKHQNEQGIIAVLILVEVLVVVVILLVVVVTVEVAAAKAAAIVGIVRLSAWLTVKVHIGVSQAASAADY